MIFLDKFGFPMEFMSIHSQHSEEGKRETVEKEKLVLYNFDLIYIRISDRLNNVIYVI